MSSSTKARVGVSYSWGEESNGPDKGAVDQFCEELRKCGIGVVRDKDEVKHGESLSQFMSQLAAMDHLCVFLSDGYLRSPNCMYEILVAWRRCSGAPQEFRARVHVWTLKSCPKIHDVAGRLEYVKYWKEQRERLESLVEEFGTEGLGEADLAAYRRVKDFQNSVSEILAYVADTLRPTSLPDFVGWIRRVFPEVGPPAEEVEQLRTRTAQAIDKRLNQVPALAAWLGKQTPSFVAEQSGGWVLLPQYKAGTGSLVEPLKAIVSALPGWAGSAAERTGLGDIIGGMVVLGVDSAWLAAQVANRPLGEVAIPGEKGSASGGADSHDVNLLHLVATALAGSHARLQWLFCPPLEDPDVVAEPPMELLGTTDADKDQELKKHFIRQLLSPTLDLTNPDPSTVDAYFEHAREVLVAAMQDDGRPRMGIGPAYVKHRDMLQKLELKDLLLLQPDKRSVRSVLKMDQVRVFRQLWQLYQFLKSTPTR